MMIHPAVHLNNRRPRGGDYEEGGGKMPSRNEKGMMINVDDDMISVDCGDSLVIVPTATVAAETSTPTRNRQSQSSPLTLAAIASLADSAEELWNSVPLSNIDEDLDISVLDTGDSFVIPTMAAANTISTTKGAFSSFLGGEKRKSE